jgi:hypothetical protein
VSPEYVVTGTGGSQQTNATERVQILAGIQGPAGADGAIFRWMGEWDVATQYQPDDAVYYAGNGALYLCTSASLGEIPPDFANKWDVLADPTIAFANHVDAIDGDHPNFQWRHGFEVDKDTGDYFTTLSYDDTTRTVTIESAGTDPDLTDPVNDFKYYRRGRRTVKTGPINLVHADADGGYFFYFDKDDNFVVTTYPWTLEDHIPVAYIYFNSSTGDGVAYEERHTAYVDPRLHESLHFSIGTFLQSGFALSDYTLSPGSPADADVRWTQAEGVVRDEDIPTIVPLVDATEKYTMAYRSGTTGQWVFVEDQDSPVLWTGAGYVEYNEFTGATWQLTPITTTQFMNYFIFNTPALTPKRNVLVVPGQAVFATKVGAEAEIVESLDMGGLIAQEIAASYRVIVEVNASYGTDGKHRIVQVDQIFLERSGAVTASSPTDHSTLSGRTDPTSHPAAAISNVPAGDIAATTVQAAIDELDTEKYNEGDRILAHLGTEALPGLSFAGQPDEGMWYDSIYGSPGIVTNGSRAAVFSSFGQNFFKGSVVLTDFAGNHTFLQNGAAGNELNIKATTIPQSFKVWNWDDGGDKEWFEARWSGDVLYLGTDYILGIGTKPAGPREMRIMYGGDERIRLDGSGITTFASILPSADGTLDLGSPSLKFANVYADNIAASPGGVVFLDDGSAAAPSLAFTTAPTTGFFRDLTWGMTYSHGGTARTQFTNFGFQPVTDGTMGLGLSSKRFADAHIKEIRLDGGTVGDTAISEEGTPGDGIWFDSGVGGTPALATNAVDQGYVTGHKQKINYRLHGGSIPNPTSGSTRIAGRAVETIYLKTLALYMVGGTSATVNVKIGSVFVRTVDITIPAAGGWYTTTTFDNGTIVSGNTIELHVVTAVGAPTEIAFQLECESSNMVVL